MPSPYITAEGHRALVSELEQLRYKTRVEVVSALSAAAAEGDRSENAEYIYRKKQLREIDRRIRYLIKRLDQLVVVDRLPQDLNRVYFGAHVEVEEYSEKQVEVVKQATYRIVGSDEIDLDRGWISVDSPVAKAMLSKGVDDEVSVKTPVGWRTLTILSVHYSNQNSMH